MHADARRFQQLPACRSGLLLLAVLAFGSTGIPQEKTSRPQDSRALVTRHLDMNYNMPIYQTKEQWLERKEALRKQILVSAGLWPMPAKTPLNSQIFDRLDRNGYSIEKVFFESYPGFFVTGNLYRPLGRSGPFPAVLSPHGHWAYGRLQDSETCSIPVRCMNLAKQGYVVFSFDMVGYNDSRQVNHRYQGEREELWGFGSLGLHLWNSIRSVDFLESLPEVDRSRLACTGASGGGTQTFLLTAVDDRIAISAPVNMISAHMQGGDVCENAPNLRVDTNNMEIGAMMAPRPLLLVSATGDWTKNTLEIEYPAIQKIYRLLGAEDKIHAVRISAEHNYNKESREQVYRWFGKWILGLPDASSIQEKDQHVEFPSQMLVFYGRSMPENARTEQQVVDEFVRNAAATVEKLKPVDEAGRQRYREAFEPALRYSLMAEFPAPSAVEAFAIQPAQQPAYRVVRFNLSRPGKGDRVPATLWLPGGETEVRQAVLLAHPRGAEPFELAGAPEKMIQTLLKAGCSVLIPDLFNCGRAGFERTDIKKFFTTYNRTDDANRVQDVLTSLAYLRGKAGKLPIKVVGYEKAGLWCLLARGLAADSAAFNVDTNQFEADSDAAYLKELNIPGIRRAGDFRTAGILSMQGPLWIQNPGKSFPLEWLRSVYAALGKQGLLKIQPERATDPQILEWLLK
jgi:dienelactone hydrolase